LSDTHHTQHSSRQNSAKLAGCNAGTPAASSSWFIACATRHANNPEQAAILAARTSPTPGCKIAANDDVDFPHDILQDAVAAITVMMCRQATKQSEALHIFANSQPAQQMHRGNAPSSTKPHSHVWFV
jgi:hypothetical protein